MTAQIHSRPLIQGALMHKVHGDKAWDMPPFRRIQDSGIHWGLGSDATAVTTSNPFYTLSLAVTGRMIGGRQVNRQTITREEALIAHTRSNAVFLFQEGNLGSLAPGKYADLLVLDRDYLTVPDSEIKDITTAHHHGGRQDRARRDAEIAGSAGAGFRRELRPSACSTTRRCSRTRGIRRAGHRGTQEVRDVEAQSPGA